MVGKKFQKLKAARHAKKKTRKEEVAQKTPEYWGTETETEPSPLQRIAYLWFVRFLDGVRT
jgi:hypothetical protein